MAEILYNANKVPATFLRAVGRVLHEWALLEFSIEATCKVILDIGPKESRLIFSQMNTRAKIEVYKSLVARHIAVEGMRKIALAVGKNAENMNGVRNKIVHGRWVHPKGKPRTLFIYYVGGSSDNRILPKPYKATAKNLGEFADAIHRQKLSAFSVHFWLQQAQNSSHGISESAPPRENPLPNGNPSSAATPPRSSRA